MVKSLSVRSAQLRFLLHNLQKTVLTRLEGRHQLFQGSVCGTEIFAGLCITGRNERLLEFRQHLLKP
ncbi:hypothetical protein BCAR13_520153 [Paraburkholderia caribensis]|nr:hypothetical protein BCAR13_520153 [Paraburkholderia caribensis]